MWCMRQVHSNILMLGEGNADSHLRLVTMLCNNKPCLQDFHEFQGMKSWVMSLRFIPPRRYTKSETELGQDGMVDIALHASNALTVNSHYARSKK